ncbi:MAG: HHL1-like protein [Cyanobacteria bacterium P01_D01_bin.156]
MATGFGKVKPKPKVSEATKRRKQASQEMDQRRESGDPEFEVHIRIKDKKQWYPVGVIAVKRSVDIDRAIFASEDDLLQGAFRIYPILRKNKTNLEYGYRVKAFKDEPITLAVPPKPGVAGGLQTIANQVKGSFAGLFKK